MNQPGPADYSLEKYKAIQPGETDSMGKSKTSHAANRSLYKMEREKTKKVYFPEYAREFSNTQGPGPAVYLYEKVDNYNFEKNKKPKLGSMSRVSSYYFIFLG